MWCNLYSHKDSKPAAGVPGYCYKIHKDASELAEPEASQAYAHVEQMLQLGEPRCITSRGTVRADAAAGRAQMHHKSMH